MQPLSCAHWSPRERWPVDVTHLFRKCSFNCSSNQLSNQRPRIKSCYKSIRLRLLYSQHVTPISNPKPNQQQCKQDSLLSSFRSRSHPSRSLKRYPHAHKIVLLRVTQNALRPTSPACVATTDLSTLYSLAYRSNVPSTAARLLKPLLLSCVQRLRLLFQLASAQAHDRSNMVSVNWWAVGNIRDWSQSRSRITWSWAHQSPISKLAHLSCKYKWFK